MKKIIVMLLLVAMNAFAAEGAADTLAGIILFIPGLTLAGIAIALPIIGIQFLFELLCEYWGKATTFGKIVVFCIPGTALSGGLFYSLINYIYPYVIKEPLISSIVFCGIVGIVCRIIGWDEWRERDGRAALVARCILKIPVYPFILLWIVLQVIGAMLKRLFVKSCENNYCYEYDDEENDMPEIDWEATDES